jgi:hypothetical protein
MADVMSVVSGTGKAVGRYFSVVSVLPSILLVVYVFLLVSSGGWQHPPDWHAAFAALRNLGLVGATLLAVGGITVALVLHPLQFGMVQFLEGYWGPGWLAQQILTSRVLHHRERWQWLNGSLAAADRDTNRLKDKEDPLTKQLKPAEKVARRFKLISQREQARRAKLRYPEEAKHLMPTRLGNVLRRYEILAGAPYSLDAPTVLTPLALVAEPGHLDYLNDQRSAMDLAVRTCMTAAIACVVTVVFLWHSGLWLLLALIPYGITYAAYRGSVIAAESYGTAMSAIIALNRFKLYEHMRMPQPPTTARERDGNAALMDLLKDYKHKVSLIYWYQR